MSTAGQISAWTLRRWLSLCLIVFAVQMALIFWLGERKLISPRPSAPAPVLALVTDSTTELLALRDPTLFALPRRQGFAGLAWLTVTNGQLPVVDSTETPRWLELQPAQLGASFHLLVDTNLPTSSHTLSLPEPELNWPRGTTSEISFPSVVRVEGSPPLPNLLNPMQLPAWPPKMLGPTDTDLVTNSVVEIMIGGEGRPVSWTLLAGSGSRSADDFALNQARNARFKVQEPIVSQGPASLEALSQLRWCRLVFEWQTRPGTNVTNAGL